MMTMILEVVFPGLDVHCFDLTGPLVPVPVDSRGQWSFSKCHIADTQVLTLPSVSGDMVNLTPGRTRGIENIGEISSRPPLVRSPKVSRGIRDGGS